MPIDEGFRQALYLDYNNSSRTCIFDSTHRGGHVSRALALGQACWCRAGQHSNGKHGSKMPGLSARTIFVTLLQD
jgi:hypothetical protein